MFKTNLWCNGTYLNWNVTPCTVHRLHPIETDPWFIGTGYSVRPVTAVIKTKHAGLNPMDLGSVAYTRLVL